MARLVDPRPEVNSLGPSQSLVLVQDPPARRARTRRQRPPRKTTQKHPRRRRSPHPLKTERYPAPYGARRRRPPGRGSELMAAAKKLSNGRFADTWDPKLGAEICARIANGEFLAHICRDPGMPLEQTVRAWVLH